MECFKTSVAALRSRWPLRLLACMVTLFITMTSIVHAVHAATPPRKLALLIGNGRYAAVPALHNPENDVRLVAQSLRDIGFITTEGTNLSRAAMLSQVREFSSAIRPGDVAIFYYAGHAVQADGTNFLIPVDLQLANAAALARSAVAASDVVNMLATRNDAVRIVILDACRNNPLPYTPQPGTADGSGNGRRGLAQLDTPRHSRGMYIAYSTAPGQVAYDGYGKNSPYAIALAKEIGRPGLTITEIFQNVRHGVIHATAAPATESQIPWESSSLTENLVLVAAAGPRVATVPRGGAEAQSPLFNFTPIDLMRPVSKPEPPTRRHPVQLNKQSLPAPVSFMN